MIGTSTAEYLFIRACIIFLHWISPSSILICAIAFVTKPRLSALSTALAFWLVLETAFYLLIYFPRKHYLQKPALHPELGMRGDRRRLFDRCMASIPDPEYYLVKWFMDSPMSEIKRENVKDFLRWAFLSTQEINEAEEKEVNDYTVATEKLLGTTFAPGRGKAKCLRLTFDKVNMLHRSLFWYFVSRYSGQ